MSEYNDYPCDLCGSTDAKTIRVVEKYTGGQPIHVCRQCGFVYVRSRRSAKKIADAWSDSLFEEEGKFEKGAYSARIPAIKARQIFVADTIDTQLQLRGKTVCDIGAGEGQFLEIISSKEYGANPFGIEPSPLLCKKMASNGYQNFAGTIEDYVETGEIEKRKFDIATIMWTLECSSDCHLMLKAAYDALKPGGYVVVATGSRILVPFKKPLQFYLDDRPLDTHNLRFSANTLQGILARNGFETTYVNRYIDQEWLCVIAQKVESGKKIEWRGDDYREVIDFFERWDRESETYYKEYSLG